MEASSHAHSRLATHALMPEKKPAPVVLHHLPGGAMSRRGDPDLDGQVEEFMKLLSKIQPSQAAPAVVSWAGTDTADVLWEAHLRGLFSPVRPQWWRHLTRGRNPGTGAIFGLIYQISRHSEERNWRWNADLDALVQTCLASPDAMLKGWTRLKQPWQSRLAYSMVRNHLLDRWVLSSEHWNTIAEDYVQQVDPVEPRGHVEAVGELDWSALVRQAALRMGRRTQLNAVAPHLEEASPHEVLRVILAASISTDSVKVLDQGGLRLYPALQAAARRPPDSLNEMQCALLVIGLHRAKGQRIPRAADPILIRAISPSWETALSPMLREVLLLLSVRRRERVVLQGQSLWAARTCPTAPVISWVIEQAETVGENEPIEPWHPVVVALKEMGAAAASPTRAAVLRSSGVGERRVLTASLAGLADPGSAEVLRQLSHDADVRVRRYARDGLQVLGLSEADEAAPEIEQLRTLKKSIPAEMSRVLQQAIGATYQHVLQDGLSWERAWEAGLYKASGAINLQLAVVLGELVLDEARGGDRSLTHPYGAESALLHVLEKTAEHPLAPWLIVDLVSRWPPRQLGFRLLNRVLPPLSNRTLCMAVEAALAQTLQPEQVGNPTRLYDWLAASEPLPPGSKEAFRRGLQHDDPVLSRLCRRELNRVAGRTPEPPQGDFATALAERFRPLRRLALYGALDLHWKNYVTGHHIACNFMDDDPDSEACLSVERALSALSRPDDLDATVQFNALLRCLSSLGYHALTDPLTRSYGDLDRPISRGD